MIVVDASALVEALLGTAVAHQVESKLFDRGDTIHAPHLIDLEVAQILRRLCSLQTHPSHGTLRSCRREGAFNGQR